MGERMSDNLRAHVQQELTKFVGLAEDSGGTALVYALLRAKMEIAGMKSIDIVKEAK